MDISDRRRKWLKPVFYRRALAEIASYPRFIEGHQFRRIYWRYPFVSYGSIKWTLVCINLYHPTIPCAMYPYMPLPHAANQYIYIYIYMPTHSHNCRTIAGCGIWKDGEVHHGSLRTMVGGSGSLLRLSRPHVCVAGVGYSP